MHGSTCQPKKKCFLELKMSQTHSTPESSGQTVQLSRKSEIKEDVDLAGLLEQLLQCLTESAFTQTENNMLMFHLKIFSLAAIHVGLDAMEDSPVLLGHTGKGKGLFQEVNTEQRTDASRTQFSHASTM